MLAETNEIDVNLSVFKNTNIKTDFLLIKNNGLNLNNNNIIGTKNRKEYLLANVYNDGNIITTKNKYNLNNSILEFSVDADKQKYLNFSRINKNYLVFYFLIH